MLDNELRASTDDILQLVKAVLALAARGAIPEPHPETVRANAEAAAYGNLRQLLRQERATHEFELTKRRTVTPEQVEAAAKLIWNCGIAWDHPVIEEDDREYWRDKARISARAFGLSVAEDTP